MVSRMSGEAELSSIFRVRASQESVITTMSIDALITGSYHGVLSGRWCLKRGEALKPGVQSELLIPAFTRELTDEVTS